jgi:hypothetical protein
VRKSKGFEPSGLDEVFQTIIQTNEALRQAGYYDAHGKPRTDEEGQRILRDIRHQVQSHSEGQANEARRRRKEVD